MAEQTLEAVVEAVVLLVQVVIASQSVDSNDWETIKKYKEMTEKFQSRYPKRESGVEQMQYPHCDDHLYSIKKEYLRN